jgi:hypothetical protein
VSLQCKHTGFIIPVPCLIQNTLEKEGVCGGGRKEKGDVRSCYDSPLTNFESLSKSVAHSGLGELK